MARDCAFPTGMQKIGMTYPQLLEKVILHAIDMKGGLAVGASTGTNSGYGLGDGLRSRMSLVANAAEP
jgi:hypothetical protein